MAKINEFLYKLYEKFSVNSGKENNKDVIELRGHHLNHLADYLREGNIVCNPDYGKKFYRNEKRILRDIAEKKPVKVRVVNNLDSICRACPRKRESCYNSEAEYIDNYYIKLVGLEPGKTYNTSELVSKIKENDPRILREKEIDEFKKWVEEVNRSLEQLNIKLEF